jgi:hypothetical protein
MLIARVNARPQETQSRHQGRDHNAQICLGISTQWDSAESYQTISLSPIKI